MCCRAVQALLVVMVVVVGCVGPSVATPPPRTHVRSQQQTLQDIAVNQMMDSTFLQLMKEEVIPGLQAMERRVQAMEGQVIMMQDVIRNGPESQPSGQQQPFLHINHNDTNPSLGSPYKVLYGSRGSLSPSFPQFYPNGVRYEWRVVLPLGTRPVFTWDFIDMENDGVTGCYDSVTVSSPDDVKSPAICGESIPANSHPMYNITDNIFSVVFTSDGSVGRRGFMLYYTAEVVTP